MQQIVFMHGHTCAGKTTLSSKLARHLISIGHDVRLLSSNALRREICPMSDYHMRKDYFDDTSPKASSHRDQVYLIMAMLAKENLAIGRSVILDATYNKFYRRDWIYRIAKDFGLKPIIIHCFCENKKEILKRIISRSNPHIKDPDKKMTVSQQRANIEQELEILQMIKLQCDPIPFNRSEVKTNPAVILYDALNSELTLSSHKEAEFIEDALQRVIPSSAIKHLNRIQPFCKQSQILH